MSADDNDMDLEALLRRMKRRGAQRLAEKTGFHPDAVEAVIHENQWANTYDARLEMRLPKAHLKDLKAVAADLGIKHTVLARHLIRIGLQLLRQKPPQ